MRALVPLVPFLAAFLGCDSPGRTDREDLSLKRQIEALDRRVESIPNLGEPPISISPSIEALVVEVRNDGAVVLYFGKQSGVRNGATFDVFRGAIYKGTARVTDVRELTCSSVIAHGMSPFAVGDSAIYAP